MECVLASSMALAWVLPDEASDRAERLLAHVSPKSALWVPALWWYEVGNALLAAQRRKRLVEADRLRALERNRRLPLRIDGLLTPSIVERFQAMAQACGLSVCDAAYLELAQRKDRESLRSTTLCRRPPAGRPPAPSQLIRPQRPLASE